MDKAKQLRAISLATLVSLLLGVPTARAFITSEEQIWESDIFEAKRRARDFLDHLRREQELELERESTAHERTLERIADQKAYEKLRTDYLVERDSYPDESIERDRLEREYEESVVAQEREVDGHRRKYIVNRARVRDVLARDAYIDEMLENGLVKSPGGK